MINKFIYITDYSDPRNRSFKVKIEGEVNGFTLERMSRWINKWTDPAQKIRNTSTYRTLYHDHYKYLVEYIPSKCVTRLEAEKKAKEKEVNDKRAKYLKKGLADCIDMFEKIQHHMSPEEEFYNKFVWETKILFFSYYDLCTIDDIETEAESEISAKDYLKTFQKSIDKPDDM